jgi:thiol:disulfide interchange protein DsbD
MKRYTLLTLSLFFAAMNAQAQPNAEQHITASIACGTKNYAKPFTLGLHLVVAEGWHTYWKNPGDSGLPLDAEIDSPDGFTLGELQYPTPQKFPGDGSVSYGYEDSVVVLVKVFPPKDKQIDNPHFRIKLKWLVCKQVCLPGGTAVEFDASKLDVNDLKDGKRLIDRWTARLPQPGAGFNLENTSAEANPSGNGYLLKVRFLGVSPGTITDFYPEEIPDFVADYSKLQMTDSGFTMPVEPSEKGKKLAEIKGIVKLGTQGYAVRIAVKQ